MCEVVFFRIYNMCVVVFFRTYNVCGAGILSDLQGVRWYSFGFTMCVVVYSKDLLQYCANYLRASI